MTKTIHKGPTTNNSSNHTVNNNSGPVMNNTNHSTENKNKNKFGAMEGGTMNFNGTAATTVGETLSPSETTPANSASLGGAAGSYQGATSPSVGEAGGNTGSHTVQQDQIEGPSDHVVHQQDWVEADNIIANFGDSPTESDYNVETIKSWLMRDHRIQQGQFKDGPIQSIGTNVIATVARGKLDFFRYFKADAVFTMRWNVPKTTYGAFVLGFHYGGNLPIYSTDKDAGYVKVFSSLQGSSCVLEVPYFYPYPYFDLARQNVYMGDLYLYNFSGAHSVTDVVPTPYYRLYLRFKNITVRMPYPRSLMRQGAALAIIGTTLGVVGAVADAVSSTANAVSATQAADETAPAPTYQPSGFSTFRITNEPLNLVRADGFDPSVPISRVVQPFVGKRDDFAITDYHQLLSIPSYRELIADASGSFNQFVEPSHFWVGEIETLHTHWRCDYHIRLVCASTPFHSGRLRIVYVPSIDDNFNLGHDNVVQGMSIIWDIQDGTSMEFDLPYGSNTEYNDPPGFLLIQENPFESSFGDVSVPVIIMQSWASNMRVLGYDINTQVMRSDPWNEAVFSTSLRPQWEPQGIENLGFYHDLHSSDVDTNTSIITTARRPGEVFATTNTRFVANGRKIIDLTGAYMGVAPYSSVCYVSKLLRNCAGMRGSLKCMIKPYGAVPDGMSYNISVAYGHMRVQPGEFTSRSAPIISNDQGVAEFAIPYMTPLLFYTGSWDLVQWPTMGPLIILDAVGGAPEDELTLNVYVSAFDDFQMLMPGDYQYYPPTRRGQPASVPSVLDI